MADKIKVFMVVEMEVHVGPRTLLNPADWEWHKFEGKIRDGLNGVHTLKPQNPRDARICSVFNDKGEKIY